MKKKEREMKQKKQKVEDPQALAKREVEEQLPQAQADLEELRAFVVVNEDDQAFAVGVIREIKQKHKQLEDRRKEITVPLRKALDSINDLFRPMREALEEGEKILKLKVASYLEARERENQKALLEAAEAETVEEAAEALTQIETATPVKGTSMRHKWEAEVFRPELVPTEFLSPDLDKIEASMRASVEISGEPMPIPGVRFHKKPIVTVRQ